MRIFENANFSFIPNRRRAYIISAVLLLLSIGSLATRGLQVGIDFKGGMEFVVEASNRLEATEVRNALTQPLGGQPEVKTYGEVGLLIRTAAQDDISAVESTILNTIRQEFPQSTPKMVKTNVVGPRFAEDLMWGAFYAVLGSLLVIFLYILLRFEWQFSTGAVAALLHDVTITLGIFSLLAGIAPFSLQVDQSIIAALLTVVGYSLNDTVVVFDRVREYTNMFKTDAYNDVVNRSINNTLSRTFMTSITTLLVVTILFFFGGEVLRGFSFALIIGVLVGTYSSIFVASPVVVELRDRAKAAA
ncbi:protein translocase subunit SecF [Salisaeta longa]|uniref:protein translocase subunit SecF n=1 Tax=Salisaeta longa TaxID=503170 RepID=UPI0003B3063A|nr:protein translocase subunit SecF [Salisaeta longa]